MSAPMATSSQPVARAAFRRDERGFTGAAKALLICVGLAVIILVGSLVSAGSQKAASDARRTLVNQSGEGHWQGAIKPMEPSHLAQPGPDIQAADKALHDKFEIIPADFKGTPRPNQLTQADYDKVVKMYADIASGKTDIQFNAKDSAQDKNFQGLVMKDLAEIMQTPVGRGLIQGLAYEPKNHTLTLGYDRDDQGNLDTTNAFTDAANIRDRGKWGNGSGINAIIGFPAGHDVSIPGGSDPWVPIREDVVLFHEMVHAYHMTHGTMDDSPIRPGHGTPDDISSGIQNSEYQAVGLGDHVNDPFTENKYRAERNQINGHPGSLPGDDMAHRGTYVVHTGGAGPPP